MPIYGYACKICDHTLDALQKIADDPLVECPACGESGLKRQLSAPRFRLKGQGWYETDFKSDNQRNLAGQKEASKTDEKSTATPGDKPTDKSAGKSAKPADKKSDKTKSSSDHKASTA